jgi:acyltransferase
VIAMVFGHTLDAVLAPETRLSPAVALYWKARGLTAPLFLVVAGWAVTVAIRRGRERGADVRLGRLPRALLLLGIGYALRWPGWGLERLRAGDPAVWAHLLAFDALHTIAVSLLATSAVLALRWSDREKALLLGAVAVGAVALGLLPPAPVVPAATALPHGPALAVAQAARGTSPFPLFPWCAYFLAGAVLGLVAGDASARRATWMAAAGAVLAGATVWTGVGTMPPGDPRLVAFRIGAVLLALAALSRVPPSLAARAAPLGRASLAVYAIHVPLVYGWSTLDGLAARIGPTLPVSRALGLAVVVLAVSLALAAAVKAARREVVDFARRAWQRRESVAALLPSFRGE